MTAPYPYDSPQMTSELVLIQRFNRILLESIPQAFIAIPVFCYLMAGHVPWWQWLLWGGGFLLLELVLWRYSRRLLRAGGALRPTVENYHVLRTLMGLSAALWGSMLFFMFPPADDVLYRLVSILWLSGAFALLLLMLAPCRDMHLLYFVGYWAYPLYRFAAESDAMYQTLLAGATLYIVAGWLFVCDFRDMLFATLQLQGSNHQRLGRLQELSNVTSGLQHELQAKQARLKSALAEQRWLAEHDGLTGCYNARALRAWLDRCQQRSQNEGLRWSLAMFDLDHFKRVNDTFGHQTGDEVLREFVHLIHRQLPPDWVFARYGGEEFMLLAPDIPLSAFLPQVEQIRRDWASALLYCLPPGRSMTVSAGVAEGRPGVALNELLRRLDAALYQAKRAGRNCVCTVDR